eukprot:CAMPEP_0173207532 /NCGR_PEP_ID=MMETSP1141-20130122/21983_1 /TAXON_ID=483371 /ORGANISM="non described non described, Strain CCMP2298" /LENGTH=70 /DNA_ID=CAMNT_0014133823 /DNA_START=263 /DNA_END=472 /DNA_ORIENTATION=-
MASTVRGTGMGLEQIGQLGGRLMGMSMGMGGLDMGLDTPTVASNANPLTAKTVTLASLALGVDVLPLTME